MKKFLLSNIIVFLLLLFSFTCVYATDNMQDTKNTLNEISNQTSSMTENMISDTKNNINSAANNIKSNVENMTNNDNRNTTTNNANYNAIRTDAEGNATLFGMNATTWTWIIIGLVGITICALIWYYTSQITSKRYEDRD